MIIKEEKTGGKIFQFKQFAIEQDHCAMKIGTDGVLLGAAVKVDNADKILDIGTGTGVIAIMLAQRNQTAEIHGVEIEEASFNEATKNMKQSPWNDRLTAHHSSIQDYARFSRETYDLIVSNPPFFSGGTFSNNQDRNNVRHTVKLPNGDLLSATRRLLKKDGRFCVILPYIEGLRFKEMAATYNLYCTKMIEVKPKADKPVERLLLRFEQQEKEMEVSELVIQNDKRNDYTEAYIELTKAFYLKMKD